MIELFQDGIDGQRLAPLEQLATIEVSNGPAMIRDENGMLAGYVYVDITGRDVGGYVGFLSGNVEFYSNTSTPAVFTSNNSGRKIANIQQGIPTTARLWGVPPTGTTTLGTATGVLAQRGP